MCDVSFRKGWYLRCFSWRYKDALLVLGVLLTSVQVSVVSLARSCWLHKTANIQSCIQEGEILLWAAEFMKSYLQRMSCLVAYGLIRWSSDPRDLGIHYLCLPCEFAGIDEPSGVLPPPRCQQEMWDFIFYSATSFPPDLAWISPEASVDTQEVQK